MNNSKSTKAAGIKKNLMETYSLVLVLLVRREKLTIRWIH